MTIKLTRISDKTYQAQAESFKSIDFRRLNKEYHNHLFNAALRYVETGDVAILNHAQALASFMPGKRLSQQLIDVFACHSRARVKGGGFGAYKGKAKPKLVGLRKNPDIIRERMASILERDAETKQATADRPWDAAKADKALVSALVRYLEHGTPDVQALMAQAVEQSLKSAAKKEAA